MPAPRLIDDRLVRGHSSVLEARPSWAMRAGAALEFRTSFGTLREVVARSRSTSVLHLGDRTCRFAGPLRSGETRTRTGDTTIFSRVLYQLSYLAAAPKASGLRRGSPLADPPLGRLLVARAAR